MTMTTRIVAIVLVLLLSLSLLVLPPSFTTYAQNKTKPSEPPIITTKPQPEPQLPPLKQHAQLTPQELRLSNCPASVINSTPPLVPGAFPLCPGSPLLPPNAHPPQLPLPPQALADTQKGHAILDEFFKRIGSDTSPAHVAAVLKQMQLRYPGVMHCPSNQISQCYGLIKAPGVPSNISPPIAP